MISLFLDIDGVLATQWSLQQPYHKWHPEYGYPFDPECVEILNDILQNFETQIILSSDWRVSSFEVMDKIFSWNAIQQFPVDRTENLSHLVELDERTIEIKRFIRKNNITNYLVIDDRLLNFPKNVYVKTNSSLGLKEERIKMHLYSLLYSTFNTSIK